MADSGTEPTLRNEYLTQVEGATEDWLTTSRLSDVVHGLVADGQASQGEWLEIALDPTVTDIASYGAFIGATTVARRRRNYREFLEILNHDTLRIRYVSSPSHDMRDGYRLSTAEGQMYALRMGMGGSWDDTLALAERHAVRFPDHHGVHNLIVEICLGAMDMQSPRPDLLSKAAAASERSIELEPGRAKYVAHRGIIRAYQGRYVEAETSIQRAIDLEDANRWDYSAMVADHQSRMALVQAIRVHREIHKDLEAAQNEIADSRGQLLTLTGLLAAVVAIVIVNAGIARSFGSIDEAFALTFAGTGTIALVFGLLIALVLTPRRKSQWAILTAVVVIGAFLMALGLFVLR
jgi:tetratricopeptide (TPR) repeat protein